MGKRVFKVCGANELNHHTYIEVIILIRCKFIKESGTFSGTKNQD